MGLLISAVLAGSGQLIFDPEIFSAPWWGMVLLAGVGGIVLGSIVDGSKNDK